jgi:hypothetical protein
MFSSCIFVLVASAVLGLHKQPRPTPDPARRYPLPAYDENWQFHHRHGPGTIPDRIRTAITGKFENCPFSESDPAAATLALMYAVVAKLADAHA